MPILAFFICLAFSIGIVAYGGEHRLFTDWNHVGLISGVLLSVSMLVALVVWAMTIWPILSLIIIAIMIINFIEKFI